MRSLWRLREAAAEGILKVGKPFKYDISLPLDNYYEIVEIIRERVGASGYVVGYGHVGDCNLHLNVAANGADVVKVECLFLLFVVFV
jgi:FAD/FMN-containing dehydrogenase